MNAADEGGQPLGEDKGAHARRAGEAFSTDIFWGFIELIFLFSAILQHLNSWFIACACHPWCVCAEYDLMDEAKQCVMRGKRVPEICCGAVERFLLEIVDTGVATLVQRMIGYEEACRGLILANFGSGQSFDYG